MYGDIVFAEVACVSQELLGGRDTLHDSVVWIKNLQTDRSTWPPKCAFTSYNIGKDYVIWNMQLILWEVNACRPYNRAISSTYWRRSHYINCSRVWRWWLPGRGEVLHHTWPASTCSGNTTAKGKVTACAWEGVAGRRSIGCLSRYSAVTSSEDVPDWGRAIQNNCNAAALFAGRVRHCVPGVGWNGWKPVTDEWKYCFLTGDGNDESGRSPLSVCVWRNYLRVWSL